MTTPASPRPLGLFELRGGLALDRGPAFSPAQLSIGRRLMEMGEMTASGSQDSLPFAEEDASLVDSPDWDLTKNAPPRRNLQDISRLVAFSFKKSLSYFLIAGLFLEPQTNRIVKYSNRDRQPFWHQ